MSNEMVNRVPQSSLAAQLKAVEGAPPRRPDSLDDVILSVQFNMREVVEKAVKELVERKLDQNVIHRLARECAQEIVRAIDFAGPIKQAVINELQEALQRLHIGPERLQDMLDKLLR